MADNVIYRVSPRSDYKKNNTMLMLVTIEKTNIEAHGV